MKRLKFFAVLVFFLFTITFFGYRWTTVQVVGKDTEGTLSAPTGVIATNGDYANKVGIYWDAIRGAANYRIFRNTVNNPNTATDVGTTPANYFFDSTAVQNQQYFYWVKAENGGNISDFSASDQGLRANGGYVGGGIPPLEPPVAPAGNPITGAKAYLGKALFWDEQMSSTRTVSCGTCHRAGAGGSDPRTLNNLLSRNPGPDNTFGTPDDIFGSIGVPQNNADGTYTLNNLFRFNEQVTGRRSPSYLNAGYSPNGLFWDGRASDIFRDPLTNAIILPSGASLESQALGPPLSTAEMGHGGRDWTNVASRIAQSTPLVLATNVPTALQTWINGRTYPELFQEAFGTSDVTPARIAMAIATHERTLFSDQTPLDRASSEIEPLTEQEEGGRTIFINLQCNVCHSDALMSDHNFHNIGVRPQSEDLGRGAITSNSNDNGAFKTPNLRNVELHAPFMHNGRFNTLEEVVEFYNRGGDHDAPNIDRGLIRPLNLTTQQKAALVAFLSRPLTDVRVRDELPPFDRPTLYAESNRVPVVGGTGRAGSGGIVPLVTAIEPPLLGNPSFTVAVSSGLGNSAATLVIDASDPGVGTSIPATGSFLRQTINLQGTGNGNGWGSISIAIPNNSLLIGQTFFGRWYVVDASAANGFAVSQVFQFTIFGDSTAPNQAGFVDFDGDRKTDISIFRPSVGQWWYLRSSDSGNRVYQFGQSSDRLVPGDYTGDGKTDVAFYRPSTGEWFILRSEDSSFFSFPFGTNGDIPAPADYDGDGKTDPAVFRPSEGNWYIQTATQGTFVRQFGVSNDIPQVGDYDNDGNADIAIFRPSNGQWWINRSTAGVFATQFGSETDKPQARDYTGDGKTDVAFWRPSTGEWFILRSEDLSFFSVPFGTSGDIPAAGDYDGDGRADLTIFRPSSGTWFVNRTAQGMLIANFGLNGDRPVPASFTP
jgi:cytochrome c peroxidase